MIEQPKISFTIQQALQATGLGRSKFYELIKAKKIPIIKVGKRTLVLVDDLHRFLQAQRSDA